MFEKRDFNDPNYKKWRIRVFKRDSFVCRLCNNHGAGVRLEAHHIRRWADFPGLRFIVSNGITLCKVCHTTVKDREDEFAPRFILMVGIKSKKKDRDNLLRIRIAMRKK